MRIQGAKKVHYDSGPNMTPLVDVVMVILIFLMLCGSFAGVERYLASTLPLRPTGGKADPNTKKPLFEDVQLEVRVDAAINSNAWTARFGDTTTGDPGRLKDALKSKFDQLKSSGKTTDQLQVLIDPNHWVKWKSLITVYQAAMDAGYTKIAFRGAH